MDYKRVLASASRLSHEDKILLAEQLERMVSIENRSTGKSDKVYTVTQAAEILQASNRSVTKWFDSGKLRGYRIPGNPALRIKHQELVKFLRRKNLADRIPKAKSNQICYTSGQAAKIIGVTSATVSRWVRKGDLRGYYIPGSQDRRIEHENLIKFAKQHGRPLKKRA